MQTITLDPLRAHLTLARREGFFPTTNPDYLKKLVTGPLAIHAGSVWMLNDPANNGTMAQMLKEAWWNNGVRIPDKKDLTEQAIIGQVLVTEVTPHGFHFARAGWHSEPLRCEGKSGVWSR